MQYIFTTLHNKITALSLERVIWQSI